MNEGCIISEDQKMHLSYTFENITKVLNAIFICNLLVPKQWNATIFMHFFYKYFYFAQLAIIQYFITINIISV